MEITPNLHISDSLIDLLHREAQKTKCAPCIKILSGTIERLRDNCNSKYSQRYMRASWLGPGIPLGPCRLLAKELIGDYFSFRESSGMISYMPKGRTQEVNADGTWRRAGRVAIKPAKWLKSMLNPRLAARIKDHFYSQFDVALKADEAANAMTFDFVTFEHAYDSDNYLHEFDSCMWGSDVGPFYRALGAKALVAKDASGHLRGRAVFWPEVFISGHSKAIQFMDRVYADRPFVTELFLQHAQSQGWHYKVLQSAGAREGVMTPEGDELTCEMSVVAHKKLINFDFYPYMDTFSAGTDDNRTLVNNDREEEPNIWLYQSTNGEREEVNQHEGQVQDDNGDWIDEDDAVRINGSWYDRNSDDIVMCHRTDDYILRSDAYEISLSRNETIIIHRDYVNEA